MKYTTKLRSAKRNLNLELDLEEPTLESNKDTQVVKTPPPSRYIDMTGIESTVKAAQTIMDDVEIITPPAKKQKTPTTAVTKTSTKNSSSALVSKDIIDLTQDPSMSDIRSQNEAFFSYDPRGCPVLHKDKSLYCEDCNCPVVYCAEKVFGKMCYDKVEHLIAKLGLDVIDTQLMVIQHFKRTYTEFVHHKMMWNNVSFRNYSEYRYVKVPDCLRHGSLRKIIDDHATWKERNYEVVSWGPDTDDDDNANVDLPALKTVSSDTGEDETGSSANPVDMTVAVPCNRTAIEQAVDVSPMFQSIKQLLLSKKR